MNTALHTKRMEASKKPIRHLPRTQQRNHRGQREYTPTATHSFPTKQLSLLHQAYPGMLRLRRGTFWKHFLSFEICFPAFQERPLAFDKCPSASGEYPPAFGKCPSAFDKCSPASGECPSASGECPSAFGECPSASDKCPPASDEYPLAFGKRPPAFQKRSSASWKCFASVVSTHIRERVADPSHLIHKENKYAK